MLCDNIETEAYPEGVYLVAAYHYGNTYQSWCTIIVLNNYEDRWISTESFVSYITGDLYDLQFNPKKRKLRNNSHNGKIYILYKIA